MARRIVSTRRGVIQSGSRRQTEWLSSADVAAQTAIAAGTSILSQSFTQAQNQALGPVTIVRTVGLFSVRTDQLVATEAPFGAFGFMVVREQARAIGAGSLPGADTSAFDDGWFGHMFWSAGIVVSSAIGLDLQSWSHFRFDFRGQRKVTADDAIVVMVENANSTAGAEFLMQFRMLVKLS